MQSIRKFFFPVYFVEFDNGKMFPIGRLFIFMAITSIIAAFRMGYEGKHNLNELAFWDILYIPFLFGAFYMFWLFFNKKKLNVTEISPEHWRSKLAFLYDKDNKWLGNLTREEEKLSDKLHSKWYEHYNYAFENKEFVWWAKFLPWIWIISLLSLPIISMFT